MSRYDSFRGIRPFERHSLVLLVAGGVYIAIGGSHIFNEPIPSRLNALYYADRILDYHYWGYVFVVAGILSIISSRWPPISETWGYTVMTGLSTAWAAFYAAGVIFHGAPHIYLTATLQWGLMGFLWWAISGLINPVTVAKHREVIEEGLKKLNREG